MTGHKFINLAVRLASAKSPDEATLRTAVSRAYYGALHIAKAYLLELGFPTTGHGEPWQYLYEGGNKHLSVAAALLSDLQSARVKADYAMQSTAAPTLATVRLQIEAAVRIRDSLGLCADEDTQAAIRKQIEMYLSRRKGSKPAS